MRRVTIHLIAIGFLAVAASALDPGAAQACIKFDRAAEMALIDQAIVSDKTSEVDRATLKAFKTEILALRKRAETDSEAIYLHGRATTRALELIGQTRVVWTGPAELNVGVFKQAKSAKTKPAETRAAKTAEVPAGAAVQACG